MKLKSNPPTLQQLFDQIRELQAGDEVLESDLTINRVMAEFHWGKSKAKHYIKKLAESGVVKQELVRGKGGKQTMVWRAK